jgi:mono/diheme cytochrome c family protein
MTRRVRACGLVMAAVALAGCGANADRRAFQYMPDMAASVPYDSFRPNPNARDGATLRAPVRGTVARGFVPLPYTATAADAERAGRELHNPLPLDALTLSEGRALYQTFCVVCHGPSGEGDGPLTGKIPPPPSYRSDGVRDLPEGRLFHVVTFGSGRMPSYAAQLTREERWKVVRYVQTLQKPEDRRQAGPVDSAGADR